ncbi:SUMF1/EgtB/PvdO family nonheme iron enzyme [uncultured Methanomethylovorans sp.]|uniref:SUMF1/EgtB/PvdO family nonheme iron enzyme n=1 Tax=uncultured Methanomethylovorans sp. TaxID=183759 RepID=UPI002AA8C6AC|nr:SUMF1/EgtB/PvdO family nonheme iron enzyme [uncultured Methanomethylovorans sp.]
MDPAIQITRETEFYQGYIRFKMAVTNESPYAVNEVTLDFIYDDELLRMDRYEPGYPEKKGKLHLGSIDGGKSKSIAIYFDPQMCSKGTDIDCNVAYKDYKGKRYIVQMEPKEISVICPIFRTVSDINTGRLKEILDRLPHSESRVFEVLNSFDMSKLVHLSREVIEKRNVRHIRTLHTKDKTNYELWYYGKTKVNDDDIVIKISFLAVHHTVELFTATQTAESLTGLLAEVGKDLKATIESKVTGKGRFNLNLINSRVTGNTINNLLDQCNMDGTCDVNIVIDNINERTTSGISSVNDASILNEQEEQRLEAEKQALIKIEQEKQESLQKENAEQELLRKREAENLKKQREEQERIKAAEETKRKEEEYARLKKEKERQEQLQKEKAEKELLWQREEEWSKKQKEKLEQIKASEEAKLNQIEEQALLKIEREKQERLQKEKEEQELLRKREEEEKLREKREKEKQLKAAEETKKRKEEKAADRKRIREQQKAERAKSKTSTPKEYSSTFGRMTYFILAIVLIAGFGLIIMELNNKQDTPITDTSLSTSQVISQTYSNSIGMDFVLIPAGTFEMGSDYTESTQPVHQVTIGKNYYLGKYEVTQAQWKKVMGSNPSYSVGDNYPVEQVSWNDIQEFVRKLNEMEGTNTYRLPSEAEWEYACRAGTSSSYSFGNAVSMLTEYAWYNGNSKNVVYSVGQKKSNVWGLYDMHGNVAEWVQDEWHDDYQGAPTDGSAWEDGTNSACVCRSGSFFHNADYCLSAYRDQGDPDSRVYFLGFRLLKEV